MKLEGCDETTKDKATNSEFNELYELWLRMCVAIAPCDVTGAKECGNPGPGASVQEICRCVPHVKSHNDHWRIQGGARDGQPLLGSNSLIFIFTGFIVFIFHLKKTIVCDNRKNLLQKFILFAYVMQRLKKVICLE